MKKNIKIVRFVALMALSAVSCQLSITHAQDTLYVYHGGAVLAKHAVLQIDSMSFTPPAAYSPSNTLYIYHGGAVLAEHDLLQIDSLSFTPLARVSNLPKMCVLYQYSGLGTQPFDTIFYSYNAKNKLTKYKTKSITYKFDYINDTLVSQRRGYYTASNFLFESYNYKYGAGLTWNITAISPTNGIGSVTDFWYTNAQIQKFTISYYNVLKEEHSTTRDYLNRVVKDDYWNLSPNNNRLDLIDSWTYFDAIYDPNPLIGLRIATNDYGYYDLQHKAYAIKSYVHDNSLNSPYGSSTSNYSYTTNANKYIVKQLSGDNTILEYIY